MNVLIVASDLSEAQRERLMSAFNLQGMDVTAYTFEAVRKVFVNLFCTSKSSKENFSLRVNKYGSHASRTFIAEDSTCWSKGKRGKKGFSRGNESFRKGGFRTSPSQKGSSSDHNSHKGKGRDQGGEGKGRCLSTLRIFKNSVEEEQDHSCEPGDRYSDYSDDSSTSPWCNARHFAWFASVPLDLAHHQTQVALDLGCTRSIGSRKAIRRFQKFALYYGITTEFCPCNDSFVLANSDRETCGESCVFHFPTVPILFSLPKMQNWGFAL